MPLAFPGRIHGARREQLEVLQTAGARFILSVESYRRQRKVGWDSVKEEIL